MVKHNNVIPGQHFHKDWAKRVKTWFGQPVQKKIRRDLRKEKAAKNAPRPSSGSLRPLVHCPTQKYNSKVKLGRGFTLEELKAAGINRKFAQTVGIAVDHRRTNKCEESLSTNVDRLKSYKARLVIFPRRAGVFKNGDSSAAEIAEAQKIDVDITSMPKRAEAVTFTTVTEEMKAAQGYAALRRARTDARLVGIRKKMKEAKEEKKDE
uniref:60S ribosomal protein L13 n=1 Tax=Phaeocystis cordata TaxID=118079 RepID=A0A7S1HPI4_9EUKA|mmetsp:Transcript_5281/g.12733  ORF Transcript_5281/g.12733 Transcript_5281/m.12733 type:complete len:208 (-) Transcript_5281:35-658(-)